MKIKEEWNKLIIIITKLVTFKSFDAVSMLSNTSLLIHDTAYSYDNKIVLNPQYTIPSSRYTGLKLMQKVWNDFKQHKVHGLVLIPYNNGSYHYIEEFIHDIIRFNMTINTDWYTL